MNAEFLEGLELVRLAVDVYVDPDDPEFREVLAERDSNRSEDVVADEVLVNLESLGYVRHAVVSSSTKKEELSMIVKILPNDRGTPSGKLADAELHFSSDVLAGLRLLGFAVWERRSGSARNITFPSRTYSVNGERRSYSLLRPIGGAEAQNPLRDLILQAYAEYEATAAIET